MSEFENFLDKRNEIVKEWKQYPDFFRKHKKIGKHRVELIGGKKRGAVILVYYHDKDDDLTLNEEINFMDFQNGVDEYKQIKNAKDIIDIVNRNS